MKKALPIGPDGIIEDIADKKQTEEKIRTLSAAVEQSPSTVVIADPQGNIQYTNPKFSSLTGYSAQEVMGKNPRILKSGEQGPEVYEQLWRTIVSGSEWRGEFHNKKKNGELFWELASICSIQDKNGTVVAFLKVAKDITDRKEAEEELKKANRELEKQAWGLSKTNESIKLLNKELEQKNEKLKKLDQLKSDFVSTVSHELRTPLAIIREGAALINDRILGDINEKQSEMLCDVVENVDRLAKIVDDILDISKLEAGKIVLDKKDVDIDGLIQQIVKDFQVKARMKNIELIIEAPLSGSRVYGDSGKLVQVMMNLLGNAVKFTPESGTIRVCVHDGGDYVEISVSDSGKGINKEIFQKF